jgi:hypothetical protein
MSKNKYREEVRTYFPSANGLLKGLAGLEEESSVLDTLDAFVNDLE